MNIKVIGAGAMGSLFGARLAEAGEQVTLLDIRRDHVDAIEAAGLSIEASGSRRIVRVQATTDPERIGAADLCIVFVKSSHTAAAAQTAARLSGKSSLVLTLQNGMGNADTLAETLGASQVIAGTTSHGATFLGPGAIRHAGSGDTVIGPWSAEVTTRPTGVCNWSASSCCAAANSSTSRSPPTSATSPPPSSWRRRIMRAW